MSREQCDATINISIDGVDETFHCGRDIIDGQHQSESHEALLVWGSA